MKKIIKTLNPYGKEIAVKEGSIVIKGSELKEFARNIVLKRIVELKPMVRR